MPSRSAGRLRREAGRAPGHRCRPRRAGRREGRGQAARLRPGRPGARQPTAATVRGPGAGGRRADDVGPQRRPPGRPRPAAARPALDRLVADRGWETDAAVGGAMGRWPAIVGPADRRAQHVPVTFADGELVVAADSTAWATQLRLLAPTLVRRLADRARRGRRHEGDGPRPVGAVLEAWAGWPDQGPRPARHLRLSAESDRRSGPDASQDRHGERRVTCQRRPTWGPQRARPIPCSYGTGCPQRALMAGLQARGQVGWRPVRRRPAATLRREPSPRLGCRCPTRTSPRQPSPHPSGAAETR